MRWRSTPAAAGRGARGERIGDRVGLEFEIAVRAGAARREVKVTGRPSLAVSSSVNLPTAAMHCSTFVEWTNARRRPRQTSAA